MKKVLVNVADVESAMNDWQRKQALLDKKTGSANAKIADIRDTFVSETADLEEDCKRLKTSIETWAEDNRNDAELFPAGKKSLELQAGTISFRAGAAKVVLRGKTKMAQVIERILDHPLSKKLLKYPDPELDKSAVKDLFEDGKLEADDLKALGLEITSEENMSIKLNTLEAYS